MRYPVHSHVEARFTQTPISTYLVLIKISAEAYNAQVFVNEKSYLIYLCN